jgi:hypothetical protein
MESTMYGDKLVKDLLLKKILLNKMMHGEETYKTHLPEEYLLREKMMKMNPMVARMMYGYNKAPVYTHKFDTVETMDKMNMFDINMMKKELIKEEMKKELIKDQMKKELIKDKLMYNKIFNDKDMETFGTYEKYETVPKMVDFTTPMMGVRTFDKKFYPETIIKA